MCKKNKGTSELEVPHSYLEADVYFLDAVLKSFCAIV